MAKDKAYQEAEHKIAEALRTKATELDLSKMKLTEVPESLSKLIQLQELHLSQNQLTSLPEWLGQLTQLRVLFVHSNELTELPSSIGNLWKLQDLEANGNKLRDLPESFQNLRKLQYLVIGFDNEIGGNEFEILPPCIQYLSELQELYVGRCRLRSVPSWLIRLEKLNTLHLNQNPLNPELAAAYKQGFDAVKAYLRDTVKDQTVLNEAKLILIGEGEVGKSCLLDALRDEPWQKHESTHGIEIKPVPVAHCDDNGSLTDITLNTWDFGGQKVYRPTHQFFFSAPAVYLVVWKPREGPHQGAVEYWINTIKHRAGSDAKVLIVGTHGGPQQRQPDIDLQDLRDKFGADCVLGAFHVNSRPETYDETNDTWIGERQGIAELKTKIAEVSTSLSNVGRSVATSWNNVLQEVKERSQQEPYITYGQFEELCEANQVSAELTKTYAGMLNQLGYVIHYGDDDLKDYMILKPDWLAKAISFVLDDPTTRQRNGLVSHERLTELWNTPPYEYEAGYPEELHPLFRKLMERFDISYKVIIDSASSQPTATSLIAQLVSDQPKELPDWGEQPRPGDEEKRQICQIVERDKKNQSANAEGLFYRLIARLHKYSLGRADYDKSIHWQRGLLLDDGYNGRALLRHIGNDIHITVRAAYPQFLLYELTKDIQELVENPDQGWAGLRCDVMVPCTEPCGLNQPGRGLFEVGKLIESKRRGRPEYPCDAADCNEWQNIDCLLQNATVTRQSKLSDSDINQIREIVEAKDKKNEQRFRVLSSQADEQFAILMQMSLDEVRNGPRLFSLTPVDTKFLDNPAWVTHKFQLTLWCEHSRQPVPVIWGDKSRGTYKLERSRQWLEKHGSALQVVNKTLGAIFPIVAATTATTIADDTYRGIEKELDSGKALLADAGGALVSTSGNNIISDPEHGVAQQAQNALLRELHAFLEEEDPGFGGLVRVQNKRREFIWVHPQFKEEY